jgi:glycosyltransferase involved in cell wall biosynthesis
MLTVARRRLWADLFMPSRLDAYAAFLDGALAAGYRIAGLGSFASSDPGGDRRVLVLRHDIDTDPRTARAMWEIERERGIASSTFFRLSTLDVDLMRAMAAAGGEVGYHYEELATIAKRQHLRTAGDVRAQLPEARRLFTENLERLRRQTGLPLRLAASHGDFVNRAVGVTNAEILADPAFRASVGIDLEAYDADLNARIGSHHSDTAPPRNWVGEDPAAAIGRGEPVIHVLVHPRHWFANRRVNLVDDLRRAGEGVAYRLWPAAKPSGTAPTVDPLGSGLRIAMALYSDVSFDSRVQREAASLAAAGHEVTIYCLAGTAPADAPFRVVARRPEASDVLPDGSSPFLRPAGGGRLGRILSRVGWMRGYVRNLRAWGRWAVTAAAAEGGPDVWHAHDLTGLMAVGPFVRPPARLVYDSHEIFLETGTAARLPGPLRQLLQRYERRLTGRAAALVTVNEHYAAVLARRDRPRRLVIVRNCPPVWRPTEPRTHPLRASIGLDPDVPLVLYHGSFAAHRGIEQLIDAIAEPGLEATHLAILGFGSERDRLEATAADPRFGGRIHVLPAVPPDELLAWVADADLDAMPLQRSTLNHWLCTPNKLWESIAAGTPVVASDFPGMRPIVVDDPAGPLGAVCDPHDPASIAAAMRAVLDRDPAERAAARERSVTAARERWNWAAESARLIALYDDLAAGRPAPATAPAPAGGRP